MINKKVCGLLGLSRKSGNIIDGTDAVIENIIKGKIKLVLLAEDCSERTKRNLENISHEKRVRIFCYGTMEELSKAIGNRNKAVIGIKDSNLSNEIWKIINGGEAIG